MEIRTLRYFLAVAREENMTRAAALLHVTQPILSKQLRSLENELGKKLFLRHSFSIQLTEEGILLRKRAEDLVKMADKIANEFMSLDDVTGGDVYFGLAESYQIRFLANAINTFKKHTPACATTSPAEIQNRSSSGWTKASSTSPRWSKSRMPPATIP